LALSIVAADDEAIAELTRSTSSAPSGLHRLYLSFNKIGPTGAKALARSPLTGALTRLVLSGNPLGDRGVKEIVSSPYLGTVRRLELYKCDITWRGAKSLLSWPGLDRLSCLVLDQNPLNLKALDGLHDRLGERFYHADFERVALDTPEVIRRVRAEPPRCLRGLGPRPDTDLIRRFPRDRLDPQDYACVAFELTHPDPEQRAVLLGYEEPEDLFLSPYAVRWEPSGEQREFFDAEQHGESGEGDDNCTIIGSGKRKPWKCGRRGCRDHAFIVTFIYRLEYPPRRHPDCHLPFADLFYHIDIDAYCAAQDKIIEIASFECK
jgi:hypothetical protein